MDHFFPDKGDRSHTFSYHKFISIPYQYIINIGDGSYMIYIP